MLSKILSKEQCADCGFCCVFRRTSIWETPLFSKSVIEKLKTKYQDSEFVRVGDLYTIDLSKEYKTDSDDEEAACFFLDKKKKVAVCLMMMKSLWTAKYGLLE